MHAKHIFVPHQGNRYRPHLIRPHGLGVVLALALLIQLTYSYATTGQFRVLGAQTAITPTELLQDTNAQRQSAGLSQLKLNDELDKAAYLKAQDMFANNYWAHNSPSGVTPWQWFSEVGYQYNAAGENLAKNYPSAAATVTAWMASPTHRANILNSNYQDVGFAVMSGTLQGQPTTLVVAEYGQPLTSAAAVKTTYGAPVATGSTGVLASFASAIQTLSPSSLAILSLFMVVATVGALAHAYRKKLPKAWVKSWRVHHGVYTVIGVIVAGIIVILTSGGGQI